MEINHYKEWKDIPINIVCRKRYSKDEQEQIWYKEWRSVHINIINMMANYLNRKDKKWDEGLDDDTITTAQLIAHMRGRFEAMGIDFDGRVKILEEETKKFR